MHIRQIQTKRTRIRDLNIKYNLGTKSLCKARSINHNENMHRYIAEASFNQKLQGKTIK